jgi:hypothetical protein
VITVGIDVHESVLAFGPEDRRALFRRIADAGLDHVTVADHVSFHGGTGFDGMVSAADPDLAGPRVAMVAGYAIGGGARPARSSSFGPLSTPRLGGGGIRYYS